MRTAIIVLGVTILLLLAVWAMSGVLMHVGDTSGATLHNPQ